MQTKPTVVLVGDVVEDRAKAIASRSFDVDKPTRQDIADLTSWITEAGYKLDVIDDVQRFVRSPPRLSDAFILPLWRGGASRNRTATLPAVCEELGLPFLGGDVFVQTVCQDKSLSKVFARNSGISVPGEWILPAAEDVASFRPSQKLRAPYVIKPQYSAASLGIDDASLCQSDEEASERALHLFAIGLGPVLCEEFVAGDEISLCFIEERGRVGPRCITTFVDSAMQYPYRDRLLTYDEKAREDDGVLLSLWAHELPPGQWDRVGRLLHLLGRVDYMRVDGRMRDGEFVMIELTQDSNLGITSEFTGGFNAAGISPATMFDQLIRSSLQNQAA